MLKAQLTTIRLSLFLIFVLSFCIIGAVFLFHSVEQVPLKVLTRDITATADLPFYTGILSQLGIFIWAATSAICLFSSVMISNKTYHNFMLLSAVISLYLGLDDAFMFHETVLPSIGIHQKIVVMSYGLLMLLFLWKFSKAILKTEFLLLGLAFLCFGISIIVDNFLWDNSELVTNLLEDGSKFTGLVAWLTYFSRTGKTILETASLETT